MKNEQIDFDKVFWHDGMLKSFNLLLNDDVAQFKVKMRIAVYKDNEAANRTDLELIFDNVAKISLNCDIYELLDNCKSGNISNGYKKYPLMDNLVEKTYILDEFSIYRLYLIDGYIEIVAKDVTIK